MAINDILPTEYDENSLSIGPDPVSDYALFKYAVLHDKIDLLRVRQEYDMSVRKEYLQKHPYTVYQGEDGMWYTYLPDKDKGRVKKKRKTKEELEKVIIDHWKAQAENPTIEEVFTEWEDWRIELKKIEFGTRDREENYFKKHYAVFGKRRIKDLEPDEFVDFLERQVPEHNLTAKAFSNLKSITRGFLRRAKRRGFISWNVDMMLSEVDVSDRDFKKVIREDREEVFDEEELRTIVSYLKAHPDERNLALLLVFVTGIRIGEAVSLSPSDLRDGYIYIHRTESCHRVKGRSVYRVKNLPKTAASVRNVVIPREYEWLLKKLKLLNPFGEWVFMDGDERMIERRLEDRLRAINKKLNILHKSPHKARKTYISILLDNHIDERMVRDQVGHVDIRVSEDNYHRNRKSVEKKQAILSKIAELAG